jgi:hypothetical protein
MNFKTYYFAFLCFTVLISGCSRSSDDDQEQIITLDLQTSTSNNQVNTNTLFQNTDFYTSPSGDNYISGEIYSSEEAEYTFIFAYQGDPGVYYASLGALAPTIRPNNGGNFRTFTITLQPGVNYFSVGVSFSGENQTAMARLVIDKINGRNLYNEPGYVDLVASGQSNITNPTETIPAHWVCNTCGFINAENLGICIACGETKS